MTAIVIPRDGWGPKRQRATLSISFDNMGEAAWVEMGLWDQPVGTHFTASFVPRLIETLGDVRAPYCIEAINTELYPDAIKAGAVAGHEIGLHAWRHDASNKTPASGLPISGSPPLRSGRLCNQRAACRLTHLI